MAKLPNELMNVIAKVACGEVSVAEAIEKLQLLQPLSDGVRSDREPAENATCSLSGATVDLGRRERCGFGEVIYGQGKSYELIAEIIESQIAVKQQALVTRVQHEIAEKLTRRFPQSCHNAVARTFRTNDPALQPLPSTVESATISTAESSRRTDFHAAVVTAGSTDAPVAEEAIETLLWMGIGVRRFEDIGVAGPQRLLKAVPQLRQAAAVVVVAGMEGALPAATAGHLSVPIFAVPTSIGYGACLGGLTPLLGMLSSCASNVAVVNIDAGFKGGYLAGIVVRQLQQAVQASRTVESAESPRCG